MSLKSGSGCPIILMFGAFATRCGTKFQIPVANWDPGLPHSQMNGCSNLFNIKMAKGKHSSFPCPLFHAELYVVSPFRKLCPATSEEYLPCKSQ